MAASSRTSGIRKANKRICENPISEKLEEKAEEICNEYLSDLDSSDRENVANGYLGICYVLMKLRDYYIRTGKNSPNCASIRNAAFGRVCDFYFNFKYEDVSNFGFLEGSSGRLAITKIIGEMINMDSIFSQASALISGMHVTVVTNTEASYLSLTTVSQYLYSLLFNNHRSKKDRFGPTLINIICRKIIAIVNSLVEDVAASGTADLDHYTELSKAIYMVLDPIAVSTPSVKAALPSLKKDVVEPFLKHIEDFIEEERLENNEPALKRILGAVFFSLRCGAAFKLSKYQRDAEQLMEHIVLHGLSVKPPNLSYEGVPAFVYGFLSCYHYSKNSKYYDCAIKFTEYILQNYEKHSPDSGGLCTGRIGLACLFIDLLLPKKALYIGHQTYKDLPLDFKFL